MEQIGTRRCTPARMIAWTLQRHLGAHLARPVRDLNTLAEKSAQPPTISLFQMLKHAISPTKWLKSTNATPSTSCPAGRSIKSDSGRAFFDELEVNDAIDAVSS